MRVSNSLDPDHAQNFDVSVPSPNCFEALSTYDNCGQRIRLGVAFEKVNCLCAVT